MEQLIPQFDMQKPVKLCKRCPRRFDSGGEVSGSLVIGLRSLEDGEVNHQVRQFYGESRRGFTDDMPLNTTLDDFVQCETPVVVGKNGLKKVRECGAYLSALERLNLKIDGDQE